MNNKKVAILFYGLSRTLNLTIESIKTNLFTPLNDNNIKYDIFIHTYKIFGKYINRWSGEAVSNYNNEDIEKILTPKYYIYDNQENIINSINFNEYYNKLGNWTRMSEEMTKYLIKNLCLALYSKKQITLVFEKYRDNYDYAIICRPDMKFYNKIDINWFNELNNKSIIIPEKDWFAGCNDRLVIGTPDVILFCGKLFDELKGYSNKKSIISELYFLDNLKDRLMYVIPKKIEYDMVRI